MTIGVAGPVNLQILDWDLAGTDLPSTNAFPLTSHFINALLKRGFKVVAYTNSTEITEPMVLESGNLKVCISREKAQPGRRFFLYEVKDLHRMMEAHPADFISAFWSYEYAWAALRTGKPTAVSFHDVAFQILLNIPDMFRVVRWLINSIVVTKAKYLIANSSYTYNQLVRRTQKKTRIIDNFYTSELEENIPDPLIKGNYITTAVQGFTHRKNVDTALKAFAQIRARHPEVEYHLIGVDMEEGGLAYQFAEANGLTDGVRFLGPLPFDEVYQHIAKARILLHPSREESFGMVPLEAMVAGTPVVGGSKSGFIPDLLDFGKAGLLCDINSPDDIAGTVMQLLEDKQMVDELTQKGREFARANYSEDVIIDKHLAYYSEIMGRPVQPDTPQYKPEDAFHRNTIPTAK
ncbi:glycosyltransferase family 4 protein [uncultured Pontibacter sp.]|uniref:glycosyltransferase family 4 protein n=1 Tax=uncultured Pontibacter sp. TaxID=453356 RepID=UPI002620383B|nr:glycosyltransferase family 4 protein [uncultured Pontibacter sp.]